MSKSEYGQNPYAHQIDERNHVEKPLLDQLDGLGWEVIDLDNTQTPAQSFHQSFTEVILEPVLRDSLQTINPWMEPDQVDEAAKHLTGVPGEGLL